MRAVAVIEPGKVELVEIPEPEPGPYEVRVKTFAADTTAAAPESLDGIEPDGAITDLARAIEDGLADDVFTMSSVNVKMPPGSGSVVGSAHFVRSTVGATSVTVTVSSSLSVASVPSLSATMTVAVLS